MKLSNCYQCDSDTTVPFIIYLSNDYLSGSVKDKFTFKSFVRPNFSGDENTTEFYYNDTEPAGTLGVEV